MSTFRFKHFTIEQPNAALKVGTDAMLLGALCSFPMQKRILDIGTGTGVLALMCAQRFSPSEVIGLDISKEACEIAQNNFQNATFPIEIKAVFGDVKSFEYALFDGIICNPPYFINSSKNPNELKRLARHTDELSFNELAFQSERLLTKEGEIWLICPHEAETEMKTVFQNQSFFLNSRIEIFGKPNSLTRVVLNFGKQKKDFNKKSLTIRNADGSYSQAYKDLTSEFHDRNLR